MSICDRLRFFFSRIGERLWVKPLVACVLSFAVVVLTFVRWVDRIARLGRLGHSIEKVEAAATSAMNRRRARARDAAGFSAGG